MKSDSLGVTSVWSRPVYRYKRVKKCRRTASGRRRCRKRRKRIFLYDRIIEQDIALNPYVAWQHGPTYPAGWQYDLETVLLHEVGHFAHPEDENHVYGCENSPMQDTLGLGEWWRDEDDWARTGCASPLAPSLKRQDGARKRIRVVRIRLPGETRANAREPHQERSRSVYRHVPR